MANIEEQLREEIFNQLQTVTPQNAPKVFKMIQTESGYRNIEQRIITMVANERITPGACIPHIEKII